MSLVLSPSLWATFLLTTVAPLGLISWTSSPWPWPVALRLLRSRSQARSQMVSPGRYRGRSTCTWKLRLGQPSKAPLSWSWKAA